VVDVPRLGNPTVTLRHTGCDGAAPTSQFTGFTDLATFGYIEEASAGIRTTIRLPKGTYGVANQVESAEPGRQGWR
jgi:hypothetical protein